MTKRLELPKFQAFDSNGDPLSGGLVYTYEVGTTTLKTTYSDYDAATPNDNPVVLDARGEADIYVQGAYKIVLKDSAAVTIWTLDNVQGGVGADAAGEDYYYPDATAADQGVTGASNTIKYAVDTISTDNGTIYLKHDGGTATTTYTLTTSEDIGDVQLIIENGAIIDGAGTLTIGKPSQIVASPSQQIFGTTITVEFDLAGKVYPEWNGAAEGNADDTDAINKALDWRGNVILSAHYRISGVYIHPGTTLEGLAIHTAGAGAAGGSEGTWSSYLEAGFHLIAGSNPDGVIMTENVEAGFALDFNMHGVFIKNISITGNRFANTSGHGIYQVSSGLVNKIEDVRIVDCAEDGIHLGGVGTAWADRATISNVSIQDCDGHAISLEGDTGYTQLLLESIKVDNCLSGIYVNGGTGRVLNGIIISNYRSEVHGGVGATIMANSIYLKETSAGHVLITGAKFWRPAAQADQRSGACIRVEDSTTNLTVINAGQHSGDANPAYAYMYLDDDTSSSITDTFINFLTVPESSYSSAIMSRQAEMRYFAGDDGFLVSAWGNAYPEIALSFWQAFGSGAAAADVVLWRDAALSLAVASPTDLNKTSIRINQTELTAMTGATITWTDGIPSGGVIVLGVTARVTTKITGATTFDVGIGGSTDLFIDGMAVALNTLGNIQESGAAFTTPLIYQADIDIIVTAQGGNFTAGALKLSVHYIYLGSPAS